MKSSFEYHPAGTKRRLSFTALTIFVVSFLFMANPRNIIFDLAGVGGTFTSFRFVMVSGAPIVFALLGYFWTNFYEKRLFRRALTEDLCWGCLYCLKGCPHEQSLCPECGLPCSGSRKRWTLWKPGIFSMENRYVTQEKAARKSNKKANKVALNSERSS